MVDMLFTKSRIIKLCNKEEYKSIILAYQREICGITFICEFMIYSEDIDVLVLHNDEKIEYDSLPFRVKYKISKIVKEFYKEQQKELDDKNKELIDSLEKKIEKELNK